MAEYCTHSGTVSRNKGLHPYQAHLSLGNNIEFMRSHGEILVTIQLFQNRTSEISADDTGQVGTDQAGTGQVGTGHFDSGQVSVEQAGTGRVGTGQSGATKTGGRF